jgi:hypothetical protein
MQSESFGKHARLFFLTIDAELFAGSILRDAQIDDARLGPKS